MANRFREMRTIKVGIIGTGAMAHTHASAFADLEGVVITAVCDVDQDRAADFATRYGVSHVYRDSARLIGEADVDAVSIVTPDRSHAPITLDAVGAGLHTLCEKPLATTVADAQEMAGAAMKAGVVNMVNFSYRRSSALHAARRMIDEGRIGRLVHFEGHYLQSWLISSAWGDWRTEDRWLWRLSTERGGSGALGDIGVHLLDFVTFPAGDIEWVDCTLRTLPKADGARMRGYKLDANDSAVITASLSNGALGSLHLSRWASGHLNTIGITLYGERGALRIDLDQSWETLWCCLGEDVEKAKWRCRTYKRGPSVIERFVRSIKRGKSEQPDFARGAYVQRLLQACFDSDLNRARVKI